MRSIPPLHALALAGLACAPLGAQTQTIVLPRGAAGIEGNALTGYPWDRGDDAMRVQFIYDDTNFAEQNVHAPIDIQAIAFRANGWTGAAGGTYGGVTIEIATAAVDYLHPELTFANNLGGDRRTVLAAGPVTLQAIATPGSPNARLVTIPIQPPFRYDPVLGDLIVDVTLPASMYGGSGAIPSDAVTGPDSYVTRVFNEDASAIADDFTTESGAVLELDYAPVANAASVVPYGAGCLDVGRASFYERTLAPASPLPTGPLPASLVATPTQTGYQVTAGGAAWFTPTSAPATIGDDQVLAPFTLPWTFPHPGGATDEIGLCSNGFLWLDGESTVPEFDPQPHVFMRDGPRIAGAWQDLAPNIGGSVHLDIDPLGTAVYATWIDVPEYGQFNRNTFQIALFQNGGFELRWRDLDLRTGSMMVGYTPGGAAVDPGSVDLSQAVPWTTAPDIKSLRLEPATRPVLGTNAELHVRRVPLPAGLVGVTLGFARLDPGLDLGGLGAPGCLQHHTTDVTLAFAFAQQGTAFVPVAIPASMGLRGIQVYMQAGAFAPGINPLGVVTSGALELRLDVQ